MVFLVSRGDKRSCFENQSSFFVLAICLRKDILLLLLFFYALLMKKVISKVWAFFCYLFCGIWLLCSAVFLVEPYYFQTITDNIVNNLERRVREKQSSAYTILYPTEEGIIPLKNVDEGFSLPNPKGMHTFKVDWNLFQKYFLEFRQENASGTVMVYQYIPEFNTYFSPIDFQYVWDQSFPAFWSDACFVLSSSHTNIPEECRFFNLTIKDNYNGFFLVSYATSSSDELRVNFGLK